MIRSSPACSIKKKPKPKGLFGTAPLHQNQLCSTNSTMEQPPKTWSFWSTPLGAPLKVWSGPSTPPFFRSRVRGAVPVWIAKLREELEKVEQNSPKQALNSIPNLEQALFADMRYCCVGFSCTHQQFNTIFVNCYITCLIFIKFFGITYP